MLQTQKAAPDTSICGGDATRHAPLAQWTAPQPV